MDPDPARRRGRSVVGTMMSNLPPGLSTRKASFIVKFLSGKCSMMSHARISSTELSSQGQGLS